MVFSHSLSPCIIFQHPPFQTISRNKYITNHWIDNAAPHTARAATPVSGKGMPKEAALHITQNLPFPEYITGDNTGSVHKG